MGVTRGDAAPCFLEGNRGEGAVVVPRGRLGEAAARRDGGGWAAAWPRWQPGRGGGRARRWPGAPVAWGSSAKLITVVEEEGEAKEDDGDSAGDAAAAGRGGEQRGGGARAIFPFFFCSVWAV